MKTSLLQGVFNQLRVCLNAKRSTWFHEDLKDYSGGLDSSTGVWINRGCGCRSFHLAIYGDPIDYSMREKTHKPEEGSHSEEGREVSPSSDPSTGDLAAAEEGGPIRKGQCRGSVDLEATQEGARLEGQDLVDVEAARQAKNEDLILEMHKI
jgi:hypothetical protein